MGRQVDYTERANIDWQLWKNDDGSTPHADARLAVLMDIRGYLKRMVRILECTNFTGIPFTLTAIKKNTTRRKRRVVKKVAA